MKPLFRPEGGGMIVVPGGNARGKPKYANIFSLVEAILLHELHFQCDNATIHSFT
ncbi:MAG: hypothetical protein ACK5L5_12800 [Bacteroidales bacterium]